MWRGGALNPQNSTGFCVFCSLNLQKQTPQKINGAFGTSGTRCAGPVSAFALGFSYKICVNQVWHTVLQQCNFVNCHDINYIHLPSKFKIYNETIIKRKLVSLLIYNVIQHAGRKKCTDLEDQQMERLIELKRERLIAEKRKATALERIAEALEAKMKKWYV